VQGWKALTRCSVALLLLAALALEGCVTYPSTVALQGQNTATAERDARECRKWAATAVEHSLAAGLGTKLLSALGGAVLGAATVASMTVPGASGNENAQGILIVIGAGAALGFVVGSIVGTFKGADEGSSAARAREEVFTRCMTSRGYQRKW
jgi:ferric-dicitrate binding protein FerR (iron transport regulator)